MTSKTERLGAHPVRSGQHIGTGGSGRQVLFGRGVGLSSYLRRHMIDLLGQRRRVAVDLPLPGHPAV